MDGRHTTELDLPPRHALAAVAESVEAWGGLWHPGVDGGRVELPVVAGLRRGVVRGRVSVEPSGSGSRIALEVEASSWRLHRAALGVVALGAAGGLFGLGSPFLFVAYPEKARELSGLVGMGSFLAFAAWFLVVSRLRTSGPREFLEGLAAEAEG